MIVPNRHHQSHPTFRSRTHGCHTAVSLEGVVVTEGSFLGVAPCGGDGVAGDIWDKRLRIGNDPRRKSSQLGIFGYLDLLRCAGLRGNSEE
jgi:hypothetical protein